MKSSSPVPLKLDVKRIHDLVLICMHKPDIWDVISHILLMVKLQHILCNRIDEILSVTSRIESALKSQVSSSSQCLDRLMR